MNTSNYFNGGDTDESVSWLEGVMHMDLPSSYAEFLINPSGRSRRKCFSIPPDGASELKILFSSSGLEKSDLFEVWQRSKHELRDSLLHIGYDTGDNWICIDLKTEEIIWMDHESLEERHIASSLPSFIESLWSPSETPPDLVETLGQSGKIEDVMSFFKTHNSIVSPITGRSVAQEAARYGNLDVLALCHKLGHSLNGCIHLAALNNEKDTVHYLVEEAYVSVNEVNDRGWKPLQCTMVDDSLKAWLLERGAS